MKLIVSRMMVVMVGVVVASINFSDDELVSTGDNR